MSHCEYLKGSWVFEGYTTHTKLTLLKINFQQPIFWCILPKEYLGTYLHITHLCTACYNITLLYHYYISNIKKANTYLPNLILAS